MNIFQCWSSGLWSHVDLQTNMLSPSSAVKSLTTEAVFNIIDALNLILVFRRRYFYILSSSNFLDGCMCILNRHKELLEQIVCCTFPLFTGSSDIVTVCHLRDPSSFYVHRAGDAATLANLCKQLSKHAHTFNTPPESVLKSK